MKISEKARPAKAGAQTGRAIIEMVHLFYLDDNALEFLNAIVRVLTREFKRRCALK